MRTQREDPKLPLSVSVSYPQLRAEGNTGAESGKLAGFNREVARFVQSLVSEIDSVAKENAATEVGVGAGLQVAFKPYTLTNKLVGVNLTVTQDGIGPRSITWANTFFYDLERGKKLAARDVFRLNPAFKKAVAAALQKNGADSGCEPDASTLDFDNFCVAGNAVYFFLGDVQVGQACPTRQLQIPLAALQPYVVNQALVQAAQ
ncbi:hypothetical protein GCM10011383_42830 [Hymenobacter cavernae]|uniref:DUF3298 domain-containing protein n=2 Tax=Hymenobacter cavernae TaxID=2044852 RepID=A0ABQ1UTX9_9BACT|nr:hypothetical protein GCM10011383_42830 [Hymenobacter cavernae]